MSRVSHLPLNEKAGFADAGDFVKRLLSFVTSTELFQNLCGGVHILDFLTQEPDLYSTVLPEDWRDWFLYHDVSDILDVLMREDYAIIESMKNRGCHKPSSDCCCDREWRGGPLPPVSLLEYILSIRNFAFDRSFARPEPNQTHHNARINRSIPLQFSIGMKPKKIHEVVHFVEYICALTADVDRIGSHQITHVVDFGSGQNYLGRVLASPPLCKNVIALESKQHNVSGAKTMDVKAKLAEKEKIMRNKKQYRQGLPNLANPPRVERTDDDALCSQLLDDSSLEKVYKSEGEPGSIQYFETFINDGNLSNVVDQIKCSTNASDPQLMVVSLHSCGNLSHHALRSIVLNPVVKAVAIVGCCYNLVTERLGPPTFKLPSLRSSNTRLEQTSSAFDHHGFPMSERLATYQHRRGSGVRMNITARMMAVQAPENWTEADCDSFFTRHFYRALLQRIFLDYGIVTKPSPSDNQETSPRGWTGDGPAICIGSLRKACYVSFKAYVKGAIAKLTEDSQYKSKLARLVSDLTDEEIESYERNYQPKKKELCIIWSLMAFSASVVESTLVVDRWLYLREQKEVKDCWVETVFDYKQSPRNLVVVGVKD